MKLKISLKEIHVNSCNFFVLLYKKDKNLSEEKMKETQNLLADILLAGEVGVLPTDTLYGLVGCALKKKTVEKIYALRKRSFQKPCIILLSSFKDLTSFDIKLTCAQKEKVQKIWPEKISVVFACDQEKFAYLHRGTRSLAFRVPKNAWLRKLLVRTGPLIAPSANFEGIKPAVTIAEAKKYFGESVAFYVEAGRLEGQASTLVKMDFEGRIKVLREGAVRIKV